MADIFSEVDEEVRKDRSLELWAKYGKYVIGGAVVIIAATAGVVAWQKHQLSQARDNGAIFENASRLATEQKFDESAATFGELSVSGTEGYKALSTLRQASALIAAGKGADAIVLYDELAGSAADNEFKNAARIFAGYYLIDNGTTAEVRDRVSSLASSGDLWSANAQELLALADLKDGKKDAALTTLKALAEDAAAPAGVKARSEQLVEILSVK
ncbi:tetratricopeptide repeat protein [Sneathiella sp. P13V-1]|uniref:tetratricopeptide repeat protein n=1 Tax=Sneathiella sp. P13V-1 TaxID=2697366 RepID=UPI00187B7113|nr:tetratricopeptide repeat protein [Sneathiella sp. P13V-1]MBE7636985.1 tetratricopeptide repeat protein [Sneathiella sp. P13V-1]